MLRSISLALLLPIVAVGWPSASWLKAQPPAAAEDPPLKHQSLAELGKLYRDLELPLPPREVGFAVLGHGWQPWHFPRYHSSGHLPISSEFRLHFAIEDPESKGKYRVWRDFQVAPKKWVVHFQRTAPSPEFVLQVMKMERIGAYEPWGTDTESIFAIQCHLLGHHELASFFYRRSQKTARLPLERTLLIDAWNHWVSELSNSSIDRSIPIKKLKLLVNQFHIFQPSEPEVLDHRATSNGDDHAPFATQRAFLDRLESTLKPIYGGRANSGSAESLIDELVNAIPVDDPSGAQDSEPDLWDREDQIRQRRKRNHSLIPFHHTEAERKLALLGYDAVPVLMEHVDDKRFTRHPLGLSGSSGPPPSRWRLHCKDFQTVGGRVRDLLSAFLDLSKDGVDDDWKVKKSDYLAAWKPLSALKESEFVAKTVSSQNDLNQHFIFLLKSKYPELALELYKKLLTVQEEAGHFSELVSFIIDSRLPTPQKLALLSEGIKHRSATYQLRALEGLLELDQAAFTQSWLTLLSRFPKELTADQAAWHHVALLELGLCSQDQAVRKIVDDMAKQLPVAARIALLSSVGSAHYRPKKNLTLTFMAKLLHDREIYDHDQKYSQDKLWSAYQGFERIEVRNYAADQILGILGVDLSLNDKTNEEEWARVRDFVQDEIDRRLDLEKAK